jgi:hypothetical protein
MIKRNLDSHIFKIKRMANANPSTHDCCFSDLTPQEMKHVLSQYDRHALIKLCIDLGMTIRYIGDSLDIYGKEII